MSTDRIDKLRKAQQQPTEVSIEQMRQMAEDADAGKSVPAGLFIAKLTEPATKKAKKPKKKKDTSPQGRDARMIAKGRLPHSSCFHNIRYDAPSESWTGYLSIPGPNGNHPIAACKTFIDTASGVFHLLTKLDNQYRDWLAKQPEPA